MFDYFFTNIEEEYISILPGDRTKCIIIADVIVIQCILVFIGSGSILLCAWTPDAASMDYDKLARIMYLFDANACGYNLQISKSLPTLKFSNDTSGFDVRPIKWRQAIGIVSTKLSQKTRKYIELSLFFHVIWLVIAIALRVFCLKSKDVFSLKIVLAVFFYSSAAMHVFDISMALVYISHIKQSMTKGMILRYSGWSSTLKLTSYDEFAGWLPMVASCCWMRGVLILILNICCCRTVHRIRRKIKRIEIKRKYENERYTVIPEPRPVYRTDNILVFRTGEQVASTF